MNTKFLLFIIFFAILSLGSLCCKEEDEKTYYLDQEFKEYVSYNPGSYWIYHDSASNQIDSIYLVKQEITFSQRAEELVRNETITQDFYSSLSNNIRAGGGPESSTDLLYYFNSSLFYVQSSKYSSQISFIDSLEINGAVYKNVKVFRATQINKLFWVKKIGLIRKEIQGKTWNLAKYHIN